MKYSVLFHKSQYGYNASVPSLPGCHSQGRTLKETMVNVKDAILTYLEMERVELGAVETREVEVALV